MKTLLLRSGESVLVDEADYPELSRYVWCLRQHTSYLRYAYRYARKPDGKYARIKMHNQIMQPPKGFSIDHVNGDTLDNRRSNLRLATPRQQAQNTRKRNSGSSNYKGVTLSGLIHGKYTPTTPWRARIRVNGKILNLGFYPTEEAAARAYDKAAIKHFGKFASPNFLGMEAVR